MSFKYRVIQDGDNKCGKHRYNHKKHDNPKDGRGISILDMGTCESVEVDPDKLAQIGIAAHLEFFNGGREGSTDNS